MPIQDRDTTVKKGGIIWLPTVSTIYKLTVTRQDGTIDDITDLVNYIEIEDGATESIGRFEFQLWDPIEKYLDKWVGTETVRYYSDYDTSATTLMFRGQIEMVSYQGNKIKCTGRTEALRVMNVTVTKSYNLQECSSILKDLFDNYGTEFTYSNVNESNVTYTANWTQKPFLECVAELTKAAGFDFYIDKDLDAHFYESGTKTNEAEAIVHDQNLIEVGEFGKDLTLIRNRIIVYGAEQDGVPLLYTAEDDTSQKLYGLKEEIINNNNIISWEQAKDYGEYLLANLKDPPDVGDVKGVLLATIQPGDSIKLSSPSDNLPPKNYEIISFKNRIDHVNGELSTTVKVSKEPRQVTHIFKSIVESSSQLKQTSPNPEEMRFSYTELFDSDTGNHTSTSILDGFLKIESGDSGTWVGPTRDIDANATEAYLILKGEVLDGAIIKFSADNGVTYTQLSHKQKITLDTPGNKLKVKIELSDTSTRIDSVAVLYR